MVNAAISLKERKTQRPLNQLLVCFKGMFILLLILFNNSYVNAKSINDKNINVDDASLEDEDLNQNTMVHQADDTSKIEHLNTVNSLNIKKTGTQIALSWGLNPTSIDSKFIVQRGVEGSNFEDIAQLNTNQSNQVSIKYGIVDAELSLNTIYFYRLRHEFITGESKVYDFIPVKINSDELTN